MRFLMVLVITPSETAPSGPFATGVFTRYPRHGPLAGGHHDGKSGARPDLCPRHWPRDPVRDHHRRYPRSLRIREGPRAPRRRALESLLPQLQPTVVFTCLESNQHPTTSRAVEVDRGTLGSPTVHARRNRWPRKDRRLPAGRHAANRMPVPMPCPG